MTDYWAEVIGQPKAVDQLRAGVSRPVHAYLFVGPSGVGKYQAALAFSAALIDDSRALVNRHPDVITVEREGAAINVAQAREISRIASRSPLEGDRKVLILTEFHLVSEAAPALLKTIEEASDTTIFVILAETVTRELVTVASRCARVEFSAVPSSLIVSTLVAGGVDEGRAREAAAGAMGSIERARLLANDDGVAARHGLWIEAPQRLNGHGAAAAEVAAGIVAAIDLAASPLSAKQQQEVVEAEERVKEGTQSAASLKLLETRHKREQRRLRTDELRAGFATLAQELPKRLQLAPDARTAKEVDDGLAALQWASESLAFNPNEALLVQALFVRLSLAGDATLV